MVIAGLSVALAVAGVPLYMLLAQNPDSLIFAAAMGIRTPEAVTLYDAIPFAVGISMVATVNIVKMLLMKRAVQKAVERDASSATMYLKGQYFIRLILMLVVLLAAGLLHANVVNEAGNPQYVNLMGAFFAIFTFPIASYSMKYFLRDVMVDNPELYIKYDEKSATQIAIDELNSIGIEKNKE